MPRQNLILPLATPGRNLFFCNSVPKFTIGGTPIPLLPAKPQFTPVYPYSHISISFVLHRGKGDLPPYTTHP